MPTWAVVLTSAAVATAVSSILALVSQALDRRARHRELAMARAVDLAIARSALMADLASRLNADLSLIDHAELAAKYYVWLHAALKTGQLPPEATADLDANRQRIE